MKTKPGVSGFTLIELVTVIVLTAIIGTILAQVISRPVQGLIDMRTRAALVDVTELALRRMSREIRLALPNSVRITDGITQNLQTCTAGGGSRCTIEILRTSEGGRYRVRAAGSGGGGVCGAGLADDILRFSLSNDCFEALGGFTQIPASGGTDQDSCLDTPRTGDCLVIFNTGQTGANAYNGDNIAGITAATATTLTFNITGNGVTRFPLGSQRQRFHIVDTPVSFICDSGTATITRQDDYGITSVQLVDPGGTGSLLADKVQSCGISYAQGSSSRNGIVTITITLSDTDARGSVNTVNLIEQIRVPNIP